MEPENKLDPLGSIEEMDDALKDAGRTLKKLTQAKAKAEAAAAEIFKVAQPNIKKFEDEYAAVVSQISDFALEHEAELLEGQKGKTAKRKHGELKFATATLKVVVDNEKKAIESLEKLAPQHVRTKKEIDKPGLKKLPELCKKISGLHVEGGHTTVAVKPIAA